MAKKKSTVKKKAATGTGISPIPNGKVDYTKVLQILKDQQQNIQTIDPIQPLGQQPVIEGQSPIWTNDLGKQYGLTPPAPVRPKVDDPAATMQISENEPMKSPTPDPQKIARGVPAEGIGMALQLLNGLLPQDPVKNPVVRPQMVYNQHAGGTGSQAIANDGAVVPTPKVNKKALLAGGAHAELVEYNDIQTKMNQTKHPSSELATAWTQQMRRVNDVEDQGYIQTKGGQRGLQKIQDYKTGLYDLNAVAIPGTSKKMGEKYGSYVKGREAWLDWGEVNLEGGKVRELSAKAAESQGFDPALFAASALEEGVGYRASRPHTTSEAYANAEVDEKKWKVDGFYYYGLDHFGSNYETLKKKGYLKEDFKDRFYAYPAINEKGETVQTAAFMNDEDAMMAKAAVMAFERDNFMNYAKKKGVTLSPEAQNFFALAAYNGGQGNAQKMLESWNKAGYLKDNRFLKEKPKSYPGIYDNVMKRIQAAQMLSGEGYFTPAQPVENSTAKLDNGGTLANALFSAMGNYSEKSKDMAGLMMKVLGGGMMDDGGSIGPKPKKSDYPTWFKKNTREGLSGISHNDPNLSYDYQAYYTDLMAGKAAYVDPTTDDHYLDTYKLPNHPSFSVESRNFTNIKEQPNALSYTGEFKKTRRAEDMPLGRFYDDGGSLAEGSELQVKEGSAEPISYNPYSGETVEFKGPSHEEGGMDIQFGAQEVEVEGDETAFKDAQGNLQIMGNMQIDSRIAAALGYKGKMKFKTMSKKIAKDEVKANKDKSIALQLMEGKNPKNSSDQLTINAGKLMLAAADKKQQDLASKKQILAAIQSSILMEAEKKGVDPNKVASGKMKAKWGAKIKAGDGTTVNPGYEAKLKALAEKYGVDYSVMKRLVTTESSFNPTAVSKKNKRTGQNAHGIMQFTKATAKQYGIENILTSDKPEDVERVMEAGVKHFASLQKQYGGDVRLALAAYNGGPGAVEFVQKKLGKKQITGDEWVAFMADRRKKAGTKDKDAWHNQTYEYVTGIAGTGDAEFYGTEGKEGFAQTFNQKYYATLPTPTKRTDNKTPELITEDGRPRTEEKPTPKNTKGPEYEGIINITNDNSRPKDSNVEGLGLSQVLPEFIAQAKNRVEPVHLQQFTPELYQPYQVSFQDQLNENHASFRGAERIVGNDPAALALLQSQEYKANSAVLGEQFRTNQGLESKVIDQNIGLLNDAELKNLALGDQQYVRQATAESKTEALDNSILSSLSAKELQHRNSMQKLALYENLYDYRFKDTNKDGVVDQADYQGPQHLFDFSGAGVTTNPQKNTETQVYDAWGQPIKKIIKKEEVMPIQPKTTKKNGGSLNSVYNQIVKKMR